MLDTSRQGGPPERENSADLQRIHTEPVVLDIGDDVGALVLYTPPELHGWEFDVSPIGREGQRVHVAVLERAVQGRPVFAAVYPALPAGPYRIWGEGVHADDQATVLAGRVVEVDWRA
jgi:hypothetical protein